MIKLPDLSNLPITKTQLIGLVITILLLVSIPIGIFLSQKTQIFKPRAAYTPSPFSQLNEEAVNANNRYKDVVSQNQPNHITAAAYQSLKQTLDDRKEKLIKLAEENPSQFLQEANLINLRDEFPEGLKDKIEKNLVANGEGIVIHKDYIPVKDEPIRNEYDYYFASDFERDNINQVFLTQPVDPTNFRGNIHVEAIQIDDIVVGENGKFLKKEDADAEDKNNISQGNRKIAVVMVNFDNYPYEPYNINEQAPVFNESAKIEGLGVTVEGYFRKMSRDKLILKADFFGWFTLDSSILPNREDVCSLRSLKLIPEILKKMEQNGQTFTGYDFIVLNIEGRKKTCPPAEGTFGRVLNVVENAKMGLVFNYAWSREVDFIIHELGHNLYLKHSNKITCGNQAIGKYENCQVEEYKDPLSIMGLGTDLELLAGRLTSPMNAPQRAFLNWFNPADMIFVDKTSILKIGSLDHYYGKTILVPKRDTNEFYWIEYFHGDFPKKRHIGSQFTTIRISSYNGVGTPKTAFYPSIVVPNPQLNSNTFLKDGESFIDPINGIKIIQLTHDINAFATIGVDFFDPSTYKPPQPISSPSPVSIPSPSAVPIESLRPADPLVIKVSNIFLNYNRASRGGNPDILGKTEPTSISLIRNVLCDSNLFQNIVIGVRYSNSAADGSEDKILTVRFKGSEALCSTSSQGAGGAGSDIAPRNFKYTCLNNNTAVQLRWDPTQKYDLRIDKDPDSANSWTGNCETSNNPNVDRCLNNIANGFDAAVLPNTKYKWWVHSLQADQKTENPAVQAGEFVCGQLPGQQVTGTTTIQGPDKETLKGSCNRTTLALSWKKVKVGGIDIDRYQMRGGPVKDNVDPNYIPSSTWTSDKEIDQDKAKISNSGGTFAEGVQCDDSNTYCSYFQSGLIEGTKYKAWVNAVNSSGVASVNTYFPGLIECKKESFGEGAYTPYGSATCANKILIVKVNNQNVNMLNKVRGYQTDDPNYFPPRNWVDGVPSRKVVSNGDGIICENKSCELKIPVKEAGSYRIWFNSYNSSLSSDNYYVSGLVSCQ